jgi:hypothetical protein
MPEPAVNTAGFPAPAKESVEAPNPPAPMPDEKDMPELSVEDHAESKAMPSLPNADLKPIPKAAPMNIEVVANKPGFYKSRRKKVGDKFVVTRFSELGSWMTCVDPLIQKKHVEVLNERKAKRSGASKIFAE